MAGVGFIAAGTLTARLEIVSVVSAVVSTARSVAGTLVAGPTLVATLEIVGLEGVATILVPLAAVPAS